MWRVAPSAAILDFLPPEWPDQNGQSRRGSPKKAASQESDLPRKSSRFRSPPVGGPTRAQRCDRRERVLPKCEGGGASRASGSRAMSSRAPPPRTSVPPQEPQTHPHGSVREIIPRADVQRIPTGNNLTFSIRGLTLRRRYDRIHILLNESNASMKEAKRHVRAIRRLGQTGRSVRHWLPSLSSEPNDGCRGEVPSRARTAFQGANHQSCAIYGLALSVSSLVYSAAYSLYVDLCFERY